MKSEHRHELKTNELADWLAHFPEWTKENRNTLIATAAIIVLALLVYFVKFYRADVIDLQRHENLTGLVSQIPGQKSVVAQAASQGTDQSFALLTTADNLEDAAKNSSDDNMAAHALIKRGETLRAELHYRLGDVSREDLAQRIAQAQASYTEALERASGSPALAARAQYGLGLCEEELGNFTAAADLYRRVAENTDYAGTTAQAGAVHRLDTMEDYKTAVVFPPAPAPKDPNASAPTIQIGPGATNAPIKIELPESVTTPDVPTVPAPKTDEVPVPSEPAPATDANEPGGS